MQRSKTKVLLVSASVIFWAVSLVACYRFAQRAHSQPGPGADNAKSQVVASIPHCRIVFLEPEQRMKPDRLRGSYFHPVARESDRLLLPEQVNNPVLFQDRFAIARLENAAPHQLGFYCVSMLWWPLDAELRQALKSQALAIRDQRERDRALTNLEEMGTPSVRDIAIADVEIRGADGEIIRPTTLHRSQIEPRVPPAQELIANKRPAYFLQPGESIELPIPILGHLTNRQAGLKPGTYTVRAVLSYAEAPSGAAHRITSDPVAVTVTEEQIKAAEAYWAEAQR